ncbi:nicotinamide mononucleotide adenylyltransferase [[Candida] railenensis]|uniref:Nicotinamide mononucleotide adenylyltransferase n=1 Tax=[Candida] railenensis TaxID=45579 RepID=A0A9P0QST7_9ASCO|nr:nicotinamide mononucleotide adenylyltransferase [[Candida] railenensis]
MSKFRPRFLAKALNEFIASSNDFKILYSPSTAPQVQHVDRICILDSSFNPPHLGHLSLALESLKQSYSTENEQKILYLILSVKNADKLVPQPASFAERIDMMCLMADSISRNYGFKVEVGLTKHAKFVDKSMSILNYIKSSQQESTPPKITFSVGFDTIIRLFNPKYYIPDKLSIALDEFMKTTDIFCLTRGNEDTTYQEQIKYIADIKHGKDGDIPHHWSTNIFLQKKLDEETTDISSSAIRKQIETGSEKDGKWSDSVLPEIKEYILEFKPYQSPKPN